MPNATKDPEFKRILGNLLRTPPKPHSEMKLGKTKTSSKKTKSRAKRAAVAKPKSA
jgi:hypothetical protein